MYDSGDEYGRGQARDPTRYRHARRPFFLSRQVSDRARRSVTRVRISLVRSLAIVFALPVFARAPLLLGYFVSDPIFRFGNLGSSSSGIFPGQANIDPNFGFVDQALTTRAMHLIFSGHVPWWNSLEGFGAPLAGEMQSSALFPFSALVLLPNGNLILSIVMSIVAGLGMLLLLRKLGLQSWPALVGAVAFEFCGTFSWLSGSWTYSIPWLPMLAYGIELARPPDRRMWMRGIAIVAASIALLVYSGFIETSYLEGLAAIGWAVVRLPEGKPRARIAYSLGLALGAVLGIALSAPILAAFVQTLANSYIGGHAAMAAGVNLPPAALIQKFLPYEYGPIFASHLPEIANIWGSTGGYVGFMLPVLAIAGCVGKRFGSVRVLCAIVIVFGFAAEFGGPLQHLLLQIPGVKIVAYYRYISPTIAFSVAVLAAIALDDMLVLGLRGGRLLAALAIALAIVACAHAEASQTIVAAAAVDGDLAGWHVFTRWTLIVECVSIVVTLLVANATFRYTVLGTAACIEALAFFVIPTLSTPRSASIALGGMHYLQQHQALQRTYSLGPLQPNYGSYFDVANLNYNDLPIPARSVTYIKSRLDSLADPIVFIPNRTRSVADQRANFANNLLAFERVGVKFVITGAGDPAPLPGTEAKYRDGEMAIYELPEPVAYFSAPGCRIEPVDREVLSASCERPATLCRLELYEPGWTADVDGRRRPAGTCAEIFQSVDLPQGSSKITFRYAPRFLEIATILAAIGLLGVGALVVLAIRREPRYAPTRVGLT